MIQKNKLIDIELIDLSTELAMGEYINTRPDLDELSSIHIMKLTYEKTTHEQLWEDYHFKDVIESKKQITVITRKKYKDGRIKWCEYNRAQRLDHSELEKWFTDWIRKKKLKEII